jgi:hypothetical protein
MNVKRLLSTIIIVACISMSVPVYANPLATDALATDPTPVEKTADPMARLREIKDMDIQNLSKTEKKELRKEVKEIKRDMKANKNGVYLSVGAIIIIILLLILLL